MTSAVGLPPALHAAFTAPARTFAPVSLWWWSGDRLEAGRLREQLERLAEGGVGGVVVMDLAPSGPQFGAAADDPAWFSESWWALLLGVCDDAARIGIDVWLYDQIGFSGADLQAQVVSAHPECAGQWLQRDGSVVARGFDYLSASACERLRDRVHGEYERRLGDRLGTTVVGTFQDELPSLPTWTAGFAEAFAQRRGYRLDTGSLWSAVDDAEGAAARRDYQLTRAELAEEAFFAPLAAWHEARGLLLGCDQQDPARAGHPVESVQQYADYRRTHRHYSASGSDHHGDAAVHASMGRRTWIEAFHSSGWGGTLEETFDWLLPWLRAGANLFDPHAVYYATRAGWWEWAPPGTDWRQPYWPHYRAFAETVARLCSVLSTGRRVCDVGVLFPTTTVQAHTGPDAVGAPALAAQRHYLDVVGRMAWFDQRPGALGDLEVLDDDTVAAGVSHEVLVLPGCSVLSGPVASALERFVTAGGRLVAIGALPSVGVDDPAGAVPALRARIDAGEALRLPDASGLASIVRPATIHDAAAPTPVERAAASGLVTRPATVECDAPTQVREVDGVLVVLVTAGDPSASVVRAADPEARGAELGWADVEVDFDPARYRRSATLRVRGAAGPVTLLDPVSGGARSLEYRDADGAVECVVGFDHGPAALVVLGADAGDLPPLPPAPESTAIVRVLEPEWGCELVALDDPWGDLGPGTGPLPLERWEVDHRSDDEPDWRPVRATFGPRATATPGGEVEWSLTRGVAKDPIHRDTLGPKGRVPEEFVDLGPAKPGDAVDLDCAFVLDEPFAGQLAIGTAAIATATVDGTPVSLAAAPRAPGHADAAPGHADAAPGHADAAPGHADGAPGHADGAPGHADGAPGHADAAPGHADAAPGYLRAGAVSLRAGEHRLRLRLVAEVAGRLRASFALVTDPDAFARPDWMTAREPVEPGVTLRFEGNLPPGADAVQVAATDPCRILLDGRELGRQGGFGPYAGVQEARVDRYALGGAGGRLAIEVVVTAAGPPAVLLDAATAHSGPDWTVTRTAAPAAPDGPTAPAPAVPVALRREPWGDPGWLHLHARPHPLPGAGWLDGRPTGAVVPIAPAPDLAPTVEWLGIDLPPGTHRATLPLHGAAEAWVDGRPARLTAGDGAVDATGGDGAAGGDGATRVVEVPAGARRLELRVRTAAGYRGGAILDGPVRFEAGDGTIGLGDWEDHGLQGFSGGVVYGQTLTGTDAERVTLDLGRVRGSAEVRVDGTAVGVRFCAPYRFDLSGRLEAGAEHRLEVDVRGTLGPHMDAVSPTHFVFAGQRVTGLFGPVRLITHPEGGA